MTLQKYIFSHSSFSYLLFCNPTHKTETGTANRWGDYPLGNSKPVGPIILIDQSETLSTIQIMFITLFSANAQHYRAFLLANRPWDACFGDSIIELKEKKKNDAVYNMKQPPSRVLPKYGLVDIALDGCLF